MHAIFDTEMIGETFLVFVLIAETRKEFHLWLDQPGQREYLQGMLNSNKLTWVGFNSLRYDLPMLSAALSKMPPKKLKEFSNALINEPDLTAWQAYKRYDLTPLEIDHIDIKEVPPGVMLSLKTYEGRMHSPHLMDMPIDHSEDISKDQGKRQTVLNYCRNDVLETERLFNTVKKQIALREQLGKTYALDLRSKSDAQAAEAILRKICDIKPQPPNPPKSVRFTLPEFIKTDDPKILALIDKITSYEFEINPNNGSPQFPQFLKEPIQLAGGTYQFGIGGLHSKHDTKYYVEASKELLISDFDVASYYPNIIMSAGLIPKLPNGGGAKFMQAYRTIYQQRIEAKRKGDKDTANTLKIVLNGTYGKLGSIYSAFYSPDLMLAVCLIGQLNLLCLISAVSKLGAFVGSANTDGITVTYHPSIRDKILAEIQENADTTGFEYEETPYSKLAMRDVNSYIAVTQEREGVIISPKTPITPVASAKPYTKRKGAFAKAGVMENVSPTFQVCADACAEYLLNGTPIEQSVTNCRDIRQFVSIRNVTGGGVQHLSSTKKDDWQLVKDFGTKDNEWYSPSTGKKIKRKSRPPAFEVQSGGKPFGRVVRWYRSKLNFRPVTYIKSGNKVPDTEQARLCLNLPEQFPDDVDTDWYIARAYEMLESSGTIKTLNKEV